MITPPPPPPNNEADEERRQTPKPKKTWTKPTIRQLEDGVVVTESGPNPGPHIESSAYRPNS